jgi:ubiquinone/menaquinone biosynthesis C-methylase UbiE
VNIVSTGEQPIPVVLYRRVFMISLRRSDVAKLRNRQIRCSDKSMNDNELGDEEFRIRRVYTERKQTSPSDRYSSRNPGNLLIREELERHLLSNLRRFGRQPLSSARILEVGCGSGFWLQKFVGWGATPENLFGIDLIEDRLAEGRQDLPAGATLRVENAARLSYPDETFDLVLQFALFSSVLHVTSKRKIAAEMSRVLKSGGHIVWYDFFLNNPWNRNVRGVGKREIRNLFPECRSNFERITVAPPLTRRMGSLARVLYPALASLKVCSTHYLVFLEK